MFNLLIWLMCSIFVILQCLQCRKEKIKNEGSVSGDYANHSIYYYGDTLWLKGKNCVKITNVKNDADSTIEVCVDTVYEGRCYKSVCAHCDYSYANVVLDIKTITDTFSIKLLIWGCLWNQEQCCSTIGCGKDTLNFKFCLLKLLPEPDYNNMPIHLNQYQIKIKVIKH